MKKFNFLENLLRKKFAMSGMSGMKGLNGLRAEALNPDGQPTVNRQSRLTSVQRHDSVNSARVAQEWLNGSSRLRVDYDSFTCRLRVCPLKLVAVFAILLTIGVGNVWGAAPTLSDLTFSTESSVRIVNENFNGLSTTDQTATKSADSKLSNFGAFNKIYNNSTSNHYAIESSVFSSNALKITMGSGSPCGVAISGKTFGTTGAYRFRVTKTAKMYAGIYAEGATSTAYAKAKASVYIQANAGAISISKNTSSGNWQSVGSYTSNTYIDICVIYNNTTSPATYGNSISLAAKTAHVYIDGTCVMNGENPKAFTISGLTLSTFRVYPIASNGNVASIDDLQIWNALPGAAASCTAPNHVDISGRWDRFGGEDIDLTATAYSSAGTGSPIAAANITGYQWQKLVGSTWTNVSNGKVGEVETSGATSANLKITKCTKDHSGKYRCVVSTGATCSTASATKTDGTEGYGVKVYVLECYTGGTTTYNFTRTGSSQAGSLTIESLTCNTDYTFKIHGDGYYGNDGTIASNVTNWVWSTSGGDCTVKSGYGGDVKFDIDYSTSGNSSVEGEPEISVTYLDNKTIYVAPGSYTSDNAKIAIYYWSSGDGGSSGWTGFLSATDCSGGKLVASLPGWTQSFSVVRLSSSCTSPRWEDQWNQTNDISISCSYNQYSFSSWCSGDNCKETFTAGTYSPTTYQITFAGNGNNGGSMTNVTSIPCGEDRTLAANGFTKTGYTFTNWKTNVAITADDDDVDAGGAVADKATINDIMSNITLTAQWSANTISITLDKNNNDASGSSSGSTSIKYDATAVLTTPTHATRTGYTLEGYYAEAGCTNKVMTSAGVLVNYTGYVESGKWKRATTPTTLYANWTPNNHSVSWHVNNADWTTGTVTGNTTVAHGSKISAVPTAPANNTLNNCANKFMGWSKKDAGTTPKTTSYYDDLFTDVAGSPEITDDIDFYAVFAEETITRDEGYYVNRAGAALTVGKTYVFGAVKASANSSLADNTEFGAVAFTNTYNTTTPNWGARVDLTPSSSGYIAADNASLTDACKWTLISVSSGNHTFKNGDNYLYLGSLEGNTTNGAQSGISTTSGNCYLNSEHATCKDAFILYNTSTHTDKMMMYNTSYGYRMYAYNKTKSESMTPYVRFYEYDPGHSYSNYVTRCADNQVRVTYDFNGGTGTACTQGVTTKTASYTVCSTTPTKDYYTFAGWNDGSKTYAAGATGYNLQSTTTFTAQWTAIVYSITYNLNGGTQQTSPTPATTYTYESSAITLPTAPTKNHDRFDGWYANSDLSTGGVQTTIPAGSNGNKTYWAKWTARNAMKFYADDNLLATIYRASDENLEASVAGQGSKPSDPSAPTACSSKVFVGWTETWFNDETNTAPADLSDATGKKSAAKTYYAVWATRAGSPGSYTYSAYSTTCCSKEVTVNGGSPSHGTVTFDKSYAWTCKGDREITMTIDPADGYQLHTFSVATGDGKVAAKSMDKEIAIDNNSSAAQVIKLTFAGNANGAYNVTATFSEMTATSWTWTKHVGGATVTDDPIDVYVGQKVQVDVSYEPAGLLSSHTNNTAYNYSPTPWSNSNVGSPGVAGDHFTVTGTNAGSTSVVLNHNDGLTKTINYNVKALPLVHFVDLIHNETFADVTASISGDKYTVSMERNTPTHADVAAGSGNGCETTHLHLVGWIRSDYSKVADYMDGTTNTAPTVSELTNAGTGYWFTPGASINVDTYKDKTFYAVWAVEE